MECIRSIHRVAMIFLLSLLKFSCAYAASPDTTYYVYVSLRGDNSIAVYKMNPQNGSLEKVYTEPVSGGPASLAVDPSKQFLYVALRSSNAISSYRIDPATGRLTLINTIPAVDNPVYISTDKSGRFLLSAYYGASKAAIYPVGLDGVLKIPAVTTVTTDLNPHAILTDPANRFLYITNMTGNSIHQHHFDSVSGTFTPLDPAEILPPAGTGPRHMIFHGSKRILYVVNETGNSVTAFQINDTSGILTEFQTISTLPAGYTGTSKCADIHITPDNRFLYASNRGHESIAAFEINPGDGSLITIGQYSTVNSPREFDIDPTGTFLYAAGETSDNIARYRINKTTGMLDSLGCFAVGETPSWVMVVGQVNSTTLADASLSPDNPSYYKLNNAPNPFTTMTSISYFIDRTSHIKINIYDVSGKWLLKLMEGQVAGGFYSIVWNLACNPAGNGIYYCRLDTDFGCDVVKLVQVR